MNKTLPAEVVKTRYELKAMMTAPGLYAGSALVLDRRSKKRDLKTIDISEVKGELTRLKTALNNSIAELKFLEKNAKVKDSQEISFVLKSYVMLSKDPFLYGLCRDYISDNLMSAESALSASLEHIAKSFKKSKNLYLKERQHDINAIAERIFYYLAENELPATKNKVKGDVLIAHHLSPAELIKYFDENIKAVVTEVGGLSSHTALLARSFGIPALVVETGLLQYAYDGAVVIVDAQQGCLIIAPSATDLRLYQKRHIRYRDEQQALEKFRDQDCISKDGVKIEVLANIDLPSEVELLEQWPSLNVGLYRSEFLFLGESLPDEELQYQHYISIFKKNPSASVCIRSFDLGSDKISQNFTIRKEENPALGLRSSRFSLRYKDTLKIQIRALLRAAEVGHLKIMFPLITSVTEFLELKKLVLDEQKMMVEKQIITKRILEIGAMIETPASVWIADKLAQVCDFLSVGTNDLIQYTLVADRQNIDVAYLYQPQHLAVLRSLLHIVSAAKKEKTPLSLCGHMAEEITHIGVLLALGFRALSVPISAIAEVKAVIRTLNITEEEGILSRIL